MVREFYHRGKVKRHTNGGTCGHDDKVCTCKYFCEAVIARFVPFDDLSKASLNTECLT